MKYSIVVPTLNRCRQLLLPCLQSIIALTDLNDDIEILVVANGCTDDTREVVNALSLIHPQIKLIWMEEAGGYVKPTNEGIRQSKGEYVILLNNDTKILDFAPKNTWINLLVEPFLHDEKMGITGPMKTLSPSAGREFLIFFCVMIHRRVFEKVGLLDETFYSYGEDTDLCLKAEDAGFKIKQVPCDSNEYYDTNRMVAAYPIWHEGNVSHKNFPGGEELIAKNNEILRQRYNKLKHEIVVDENDEHNQSIDLPPYIVETMKNKKGINIQNALKCDGFMSDKELTWLAEQACNNLNIIEIGAWHGRSSRALGDNLPENGVLYCVDTWDGSITEQATNHASAMGMDGDHAFYEFLQNNLDLIQAGKIIPLRMSSENAAELFKEKGIKADMIFIDAGHTYEEIKQDIAIWKPLVKEGGILCGHDYYHHGDIWEGVRRAVDQEFGHKGTDMGYIEGNSIWRHKITTKAEVVHQPKIYDCFPFFNELDILEIRFNELYETVDRFVIVEATKTHSGEDKPLYFADNLKRFEKFLHKVTHIVVNDYPTLPKTASITDRSWAIERHQRDCIMRGLTQCKDNDIIIISDADEIPKATSIKEFKPEQGIMAFEQKLYYYYLNCQSTDAPWDWAKITTYKTLKDRGPCGVRYTTCTNKENVIKDAGWHFSYMGGIDMIIEKIGATAHQEYNTKEIKDKKRVTKLVTGAKDVFGRPLQYKFIELDNTYPKHITNNLNIFNNLIHSDSITVSKPKTKKPVLTKKETDLAIKKQLEKLSGAGKTMATKYRASKTK